MVDNGLNLGEKLRLGSEIRSRNFSLAGVATPKDKPRKLRLPSIFWALLTFLKRRPGHDKVYKNKFFAGKAIKIEPGCLVVQSHLKPEITPKRNIGLVCLNVATPTL
jgi:hypothetical protein